MSNASKIRLRAEVLEGREVPAASGIFAIGGGPGSSPRVEVFITTTGAKVADFLAFENTFTGGVTTAIGDVNSDNVADLIVGASVGGGPRIKVIDGRLFTAGTGGTFIDTSAEISGASVIADFFAFESTQRGGSNVAVGNFIGTTSADLVIGAGPGGGPRVRVLDGAQITAQGRAFTSNLLGDTVANFFAFEPSFRNGITVATDPAPLGGLAFSNLVVAPGIGGGPRVRVLNGGAIATKQLQFNSNELGDTVADFFAFDPSLRSGLYVASADYNRDGFADVAVGTGPGVTGTYALYNGATIRNGNFNGTGLNDVLDSFSFTGYTNGVTVGAAILPNTLNSAYLLLGFGGAGVRGQAEVSQFAFGTGFLTRQTVYNVTFDPNFFGGVFVSV